MKQGGKADRHSSSELDFRPGVFVSKWTYLVELLKDADRKSNTPDTDAFVCTHTHTRTRKHRHSMSLYEYQLHICRCILGCIALEAVLCADTCARIFGGIEKPLTLAFSTWFLHNSWGEHYARTCWELGWSPCMRESLCTRRIRFSLHSATCSPSIHKSFITKAAHRGDKGLAPCFPFLHPVRILVSWIPCYKLWARVRCPVMMWIMWTVWLIQEENINEHYIYIYIYEIQLDIQHTIIL